MKLMKKTTALAVSFLIMFSIAGMNVFAASTTQDGLEVSLITDKESYAKDEKITATLSIKNTNESDVTDIAMETIIPDGYIVGDETKNNKQINKLAPNEITELKVVFVAKLQNEISQESNEDDVSIVSPGDDTINTGDTTKAVFIIPLTVLSIIVLILGIKNKKGKDILSVVICISAVNTIAAVIPFEVKAAENSKEISVCETITVNGQKTGINAVVKYKIEYNNEKSDQKLKDGKFTDNNESFNISDRQIEKYDVVTKTIINRVTYKLKNVKYGDNKGTAEITVYSPDLKSAFDKALAESEKTMSIDQEDVLEKTRNLLIDQINKAELKEYKLTVDLINNDDKWSVVVDNALADALTGDIEEVYYLITVDSEEG